MTAMTHNEFLISVVKIILRFESDTVPLRCHATLKTVIKPYYDNKAFSNTRTSYHLEI